MDKPFEITFDFPLEHSTYTVPLRAIAQLHHSDPYYVVDYFTFGDKERLPSDVSMLPAVEIRYIKRNNKGFWVHKDSSRESLLSRAIGKAIEASGRFNGK